MSVSVCVCVMCKQQTLSLCPNPMSTNPSEPWRQMWLGLAKSERSTKLEAELRKAWLAD